MARVTFTDPATGDTYTWPNNPAPNEITQAASKSRSIDRTSSTGNVGLVKQQGDDGAYIVHWEPSVFTREHEVQLWSWYTLSSKQTIYLADWDGNVYEGQIITLSKQDIGALGGPGDIPDRLMYAKYVFEFEVYSFIAGILADAGVRA
jgi:hypothetical protein